MNWRMSIYGVRVKDGHASLSMGKWSLLARNLQKAKLVIVHDKSKLDLRAIFKCSTAHKHNSALHADVHI